MSHLSVLELIVSNLTLSVHATDTYPVIRFLPQAAVPGYAAQWLEDMGKLLAAGVPFAVVYPEGSYQESHEDRKVRGLWLKQNRDALSALCRVLVSVEPDVQKREAIQGQLAGVSKAFGVLQVVAATEVEALELARSYLVDGKDLL